MEVFPEGYEKKKSKKLEIFDSRYEKMNKSKEAMRQLKAQEAAKELKKLKEEQEEVKVEEKLLNQLEYMHLKCPRCDSVNIKEIPSSDPKLIKLQCFDCKKIWELVR